MHRKLFPLFAAAALILLFSLTAAYGAEIRTLSAGIGKEGRVPQKGYSLLIITAEAKGLLIAGVHVKVTGAGDKVVLEMDSDGAWLFADLPAGQYTVEGTRQGGKSVTAAVTVEAGSQAKVILTW